VAQTAKEKREGKFRGICRGLIEAGDRLSRPRRRARKFRGICRGLIEAARNSCSLVLRCAKFRGICRGLIEARAMAAHSATWRENSAASAAASLKHHRGRRAQRADIKIPRHLPRPH